MRPEKDSIVRPESAPGKAADPGMNEGTGLPWLRTWRGVYLFVLGCFALWIALLLALTVCFK